jgi:amino acid transporter
MITTLQRLKRILVGQPLRSSDSHHELLPKWKALAVLSSDALSSVAYATEEILLALIAFGTLALQWSLPIGLGILILLFLVTLSYRQTIDSYPNGGGAYVVAKENLGQNAGLIAAASLLIDYVLTVSVSVAAGIENLASALPWLQQHSVLAGALIILGLMVMSLRGVSESATFLAIPTYAFIFSILSVIIVGIIRHLMGSLPESHHAGPLILPNLATLFILRAFASGCSALTGVEAISNGVPLFQKPAQKNAIKTLTAMTLLLGFLFAGVTWLAHLLSLTPNDHETIISQMTSQVFGKSFFYYFAQIATALILFLAAGTSYADFPRLAGLLAWDRFVPRQLNAVGDRLVFSNGVIGLSVAAIILLALFGGHTHNLIPLYAVGVFTSFTLSQAGMVIHHRKHRYGNWRTALVLNAIGALTTLIVLTVIVISKFKSGAWMVVVFIPLVVAWFKSVHRHYIDFANEIGAHKATAADFNKSLKNRVIIPISSLNKGVILALNYAHSLTSHVDLCMVEADPSAVDRALIRMKELGLGEALTLIPSPYRSVVGPFVSHVEKVLEQNPDDFVTILIPEFVTARWYHQFLHNKNAFFLRAALSGHRRIVVSTIRCYLEST